MEHCIASFRIDEKRKQEDLAFRIYVTDALKVISENTAKMSRGACLTKRFADVLQLGKKSKPKTTKEVIGNIKNKFRRANK